jgi:hypothetical protein
MRYEINLKDATIQTLIGFNTMTTTKPQDPPKKAQKPIEKEELDHAKA